MESTRTRFDRESFALLLVMGVLTAALGYVALAVPLGYAITLLCLLGEVGIVGQGFYYLVSEAGK